MGLQILLTVLLILFVTYAPRDITLFALIAFFTAGGVWAALRSDEIVRENLGRLQEDNWQNQFSRQSWQDKNAAARLRFIGWIFAIGGAMGLCAFAFFQWGPSLLRLP